MKRNYARDILLGLTTGDALGVPVEFRKRYLLTESPVRTMEGYGSHNQPPGTWSDDSSLALCLADAMASDFTLQAVAKNFIDWFYRGYWSAHGKVFDVGIATQAAIRILETPVSPELAGGFDEDSNGNGSLMRILPLLLYIHNKPIDERYIWTKNISSLTHAHMRSVMGCFIYLEIARRVMHGATLQDALREVRNEIPGYLLNDKEINPEEVERYHRVLGLKIGVYDIQLIENMKEEEISSSGYVVSTLEASLWCLLTTSKYEDAVLKAVNLGDDTDTTGCVTGGLAGLMYEYGNIPPEWLAVIARKKDIKNLADRLHAKYM